MNTARFLMPIFTLHDFLYLLLDFLLAGYPLKTCDKFPIIIYMIWPRFCSLLVKHLSRKEIAMNNVSDEVIITAIHSVENIIIHIIDMLMK